MTDQLFRIENFTTQGGQVLNLDLAYQVHGQLNAARDNLILFPTYYAGRSGNNAYLIGADMALDPGKYCIVIPNLFGNGVSSSPSNTPQPLAADRFPSMSYYDNIACQYRLVTEQFDTDRIHMVVGFSMGAMQAYQWAAQYPDKVERFVAICGSARTSEHNKLFLDSVVAAIKADSEFNDGNYTSPPLRGLAAFSTVYTGWFASQKFYTKQLYRSIGIDSTSGMIEFAKSVFMQQDANDLIAMAETWRAGDPGANPIYGGDFARAMGEIRARGLVMPCDTDLYFRLSDNEEEIALLNDARFEPIRSDFGHLAGGGMDAEATRFIDSRIRMLLDH